MSLHLASLLSKTGLKTGSELIALTSPGQKLNANFVMGGRDTGPNAMLMYPKPHLAQGCRDLTSNGMSNQGNDQFLALLPTPTKLEEGWIGAGCATEADFYCLKKECG